jgi:hypothetical protein
MSGSPHHRLPNHNLVILTNGKDLLLASVGNSVRTSKQQVLHSVQDDNGGVGKNPLSPPMTMKPS